VRDMLQKQGYSDVRVMPVSFVIHAKDKDGNPVVMGISPDSVTEIAEAGSDESAGSSGAARSSGGASGADFVTVPENDKLASNVIGLDVYNNQNQNIGRIKDVAVNEHGRAQAIIVSVGGVLGVGTRYVAVKPSDIKVSYNDGDKKWHATMNTTADQLKSAPEFKYGGRWNANKS
jgi:sporulation protein YlmC with PRC-barrel domain